MRRPSYITPKVAVLSRPEVAALRHRLGGRKSAWLTQQDLAELVGLTRQETCRIERGLKRPSFEVFFLLGAALDKPPHELYPKLWQEACATIASRRAERGMTVSDAPIV